MNLVTEPWISVVTLAGEHRLASLMDIFQEGRIFADLAVRPHERIALMRLLICIAQAALDGPEDIDAWDEAPAKLPNATRSYLEKWGESFDLFHPTKPFLQIASIERPAKPSISGNDEDGDGSTSVTKLDFTLATGNNTTLFDHVATAENGRNFPSSALPLMLLTFQQFSPSGLISKVVWASKETSKSSSHAPCTPSSMLHAFIRRETLLDTVCINSLTKERVAEQFGQGAWGQPIWEKLPSTLDDTKAIQNATRTYMGRLVPLTRFIRLSNDKVNMLLGNGLDYPSFPNFPPEPSATVILNHDRTKRLLLGADADKAIWRELSALTVARKREYTGGALTLSNLAETEPFDLWVGALLTNKASILDTIESVLHVPAQMRIDAGRAAYQAEIEWAESVAKKLSWAMETYWGELDGGWEGRLKMAGPKKNDLRRKLHSKATHHYWTSVEKLRPLLMRHVESIGTTAEAAEQTRSSWHKAVHHAARETCALVCGHDTPRQIRAFALGWSKLFTKLRNDSDKSEDTKTETEVTEVD